MATPAGERARAFIELWSTHCQQRSAAVRAVSRQVASGNPPRAASHALSDGADFVDFTHKLETLVLAFLMFEKK
eukprot:2738129-Pleurochrysis_carterae.AAC.1